MTYISRAATSAALVVGVVGATIGSIPAQADVIDVFDVSGNFDNDSKLTGTVTVYVTTDDATAIALTGGSFDFSTLVTRFSEGGEYVIGGGQQSTNQAHLFLTFPVMTVVGYDGDPPATDTRLNNLLNDTSTSSGSADPAATPLPGTLLLLATGLGALCLFGWRKRFPVALRWAGRSGRSPRASDGRHRQ